MKKIVITRLGERVRLTTFNEKEKQDIVVHSRTTDINKIIAKFFQSNENIRVPVSVVLIEQLDVGFRIERTEEIMESLNEWAV